MVKDTSVYTYYDINGDEDIVELDIIMNDNYYAESKKYAKVKTHYVDNRFTIDEIAALVSEEYCMKLCPYSENCMTAENDDMCLIENIRDRLMYEIKGYTKHFR